MFKTELCHWIFDAKDVPFEKVDDPAHVEQVLRNLALLCEMRIIGGPWAVTGNPVQPGYTGVCVVDFSHIGVHTFSEPREVFIDIFSCKQFNPARIRRYLTDAFGVQEGQYIYAPVKWPHEQDRLLQGEEHARDPIAAHQ